MSQFQIFSQEEIESLRTGGKILRECLEHIASLVQAGVTTEELDRAAEELIRSQGGIPAFKGYHGYPASLCVSINDECVHGIPKNREVQKGDLVSLDCGVIYDDLYTDACLTVPAGEIPQELKTFLQVSKDALEQACAIVAPGVKIGDISSTIQHAVEGAGYKCVRSLTGHGLGTTLHQFPEIPNTGRAGTGPMLPLYTLIAIEPITSMGTSSIRESDDGWTILTADGAPSAHFEHTVLVVPGGKEIIA